MLLLYCVHFYLKFLQSSLQLPGTRQFSGPSGGSVSTMEPTISNNRISMSLSLLMTMKMNIDYSERAGQVLSACRLGSIRPAEKLNVHNAGLFVIADNSWGRFTAVQPSASGSEQRKHGQCECVDRRRRAFDRMSADLFVLSEQDSHHLCIIRSCNWETSSLHISPLG